MKSLFRKSAAQCLWGIWIIASWIIRSGEASQISTQVSARGCEYMYHSFGKAEITGFHPGVCGARDNGIGISPAPAIQRGSGLWPVASLPVQTAFEVAVPPQDDGVSLMSQHWCVRVGTMRRRSPPFFPLPASSQSPAPAVLPSTLHPRETWIHTSGNGGSPLNSPTQAHREIPKTGQPGNTTPVLCLSAWKITRLGPSFPITLFPLHPPLHRGNLHDHTVPQGMHFPLIPSCPEYLNH